MRASVFPLICTFAVLSGCGYVGPVVPPSPLIPQPVGDLSVVEHGDKLAIQFTSPVETLDHIAIRQFSNVDLEIGEASEPFDQAGWEKSARTYPVSLPLENSKGESRAVSLVATVPASEWQGKRIAAMVRTSVQKHDHFSAWSNRVVMDVVAPLPPPELSVIATAQGYRLTWPDEGAGVQYRVLRRGSGDKQRVTLETTDKLVFVDSSAQWGVFYDYNVVAVKGPVESQSSKTEAVHAADTFPPSVPTELVAFAAADSIEVSWQRSPENDVAGYFIYRSAKGGPFQKVAGLVAVPTYSDHDVEHGAAYKYAVSGVDRSGNESEPSAPFETIYP